MNNYRKNQNNFLDKAILQLEIKKKQEFDALRIQANQTLDSLKPMNLLQQTLVDFRQTPENRNNILQSVLSIAAGYVSKKMIVGKSNSIFKKMLGFAVQYATTYFLAKQER